MRLWVVDRPPSVTRWSTEKVQKTELASPTSSPPKRSGPERGHTNQLGRRTTSPAGPPASSRPGSTTSAQAVAAAAIIANKSQARRQSAPASSATGAARATPQPVPELMADRIRPLWLPGNRCATMSEKGGKTSPALAPATSRPANRAVGLWARPASVIPAIAQAPPAPTIARAPRWADSTPAVTVAAR